MTDNKVFGLPHLCYCRQFTIPLLFDDCPTVYQKICSLWAKLNELIDKYNNLLDTLDEKFSQIDSEIAAIKAQLAEIGNQITAIQNRLNKIESRLSAAESNITNLQSRMDTAESNITNLQGRMNTAENNITNLNNRIGTAETNISQLRTDLETEISDINNSLNKFNQDLGKLSDRLSAIETKVSNLEQLLANLHIDIPIELLDDDTWAIVRGNWWKWFKENICNVDELRTGWILDNKLFFWDTQTPPHSLQIGRVGQNIVLSKMPFIAYVKAVGTGATPPAVCNQLVQQIALKYSDSSMFALTAGNGFFDWTSVVNFPYKLDECKFRTSYIPFLPTMSQLFKIDAAGTIMNAKAIETDVRIQLNQNTQAQKMCVASNEIFVSICPDSVPITSETSWSVYIYQIAENS